jgi:hypothetical protein
MPLAFSLNRRQSYPPTWMDQLRFAVLSPERRWVSAETVDILLATRELQGWLTDPRDYDGSHQKWSWLSAIGDFKASVGHLGPQLHRALDPDLAAAIAAAGSLQHDLATLNNNDMKARLMVRRSGDKAHFAQFATHWASAQVREAAWNDLAEACRDSTISYNKLAARRDLFWQFVQAGDYDPSRMSRRLAGVLGNRERAVTEAQISLGDISAADAGRPAPMGGAGLSEAGQLTLCQRLLTAPPLTGHYVVWIAFDHAGRDAMLREMGTAISFWDAEWVRGVLEHGGPNLQYIPEELKAPDSLFKPQVLPDGQDIRLARVDLGRTAMTDPVRAAAEQVEAVVALASFHVGESYWRRMTGYIIAVDNRVLGIGAFAPKLDRHLTMSTEYPSAMEATLADLAPKLGPHLPMSNQALTEVVHAVRWWQEARQQSPLAAVLLHVRVLELLSQQVNDGKWFEYVDKYLQAQWVRFRMRQQLAGVLEDCIAHSIGVPDVNDQARLSQLALDVRSSDGVGYRLDLGQGIVALPDMGRIFPPHDNLGRRIQSIAARLTPTELLKWRDELDHDWKLVRARLHSLRNALAHGGPILDDAAETVHQFVAQLAAWSLSIALEGVLQRQTIQAANEDFKLKADQWNAGLSSAARRGTCTLLQPCNRAALKIACLSSKGEHMPDLPGWGVSGFIHVSVSQIHVFYRSGFN